MMWSALVLVLLVVFSGFFSATETAFSTANHIRLRNLADGGSKRAGLVLRLTENYAKLLSTILVGNNIVNIVATSIATLLFVSLLGDTAGPPVSTIVMTVAVLIFGEITPKTLAQDSPEKFAMFSAPILKVLSVIFTPFNAFFSLWKKMLNKLFKTKDDRSITEQELLTIVEEAEQDGAIEADDRTMIESVIEFNDSKVGEILTPRVDVEALPVNADLQAAADLFVKTGYTRLPVYSGSIDKVVGVLHLRDLFEATREQGKSLEMLMAPVVVVPEHAKIGAVLRTLQNRKCHMAVVADEYGGTVGIVTMEDILEELVGEIWDEHDEVVEPVRSVGEGAFVALGSAEVEKTLEKLDVCDAQTEATTINGWVMEALGRIPQAGDEFSRDGVAVRVDGVQNNRVVSVTLKRAEKPPHKAQEDAEKAAHGKREKSGDNPQNNSEK